jgi:hypothetical protein
MYITAAISIIWRYCDKIVNMGISIMATYMNDASVTPCGLYYSSVPIDVTLAMIDGKDYTNIFICMLSWKWDFDAKGINIHHIRLIKPDAQEIVIRARLKYGSRGLVEYYIDLKKDVILFTFIDGEKKNNDKTDDILFGKVCLCPI